MFSDPRLDPFLLLGPDQARSCACAIGADASVPQQRLARVFGVHEEQRLAVSEELQASLENARALRSRLLDRFQRHTSRRRSSR